MNTRILALASVCGLLAACSEPPTTNSSTEELRRESNATASIASVDAKPSPTPEEMCVSSGKVWSDEFSGCYLSYDLEDKKASAEKERVRASNLAAFQTAMTENADMTVEGVVGKIPDDLGSQQNIYYSSAPITPGGRPDAGLVQSWAKTIFGDWAYWPVMQIEEVELLRTYYKDPDHVAALEDSVMPRLMYITLPTSQRKWFEDGKPVFEKPLAPLPTDGGWYDSIVEADQLPSAPEFWTQAYGDGTFTKSAVWWFMWAHRRQKEGGPELVEAWQHNLTAWLTELGKRPNVPVPQPRP